MNREDYQQVKQIFQSVLDVAVEERADYLNRACGGDEVLRGEVEKLLDSFDSGYLEKPAVGKMAELIIGGGLQVGQEIGHYRIQRKIGAGGMGEVFLAADTKLDRRVAIKILPAEFAADAERMNRFVREAKSASSFNHPDILTIYEIGETAGKHFIAAEFVAGETLRDRLRGENFSVKSALEISIQIASALQAAHGAGIVHRDIKPENIMIRPDGLVKILDFGIAKLSEPTASAGSSSVDEEAATAIKTSGTAPGVIIGTASYMSPEQARGQRVDARSDIFSFGVVLYEMLAGKKAFAGETAMDSIGAILHKKPTPLGQLLPEIPHEIERIINKTLKTDRDERYQTAKDLLIDLKDVKQDLEFQDKLESTAPPQREEAKTQLINAPTGDTQQTTSSAEYIVSGFKEQKTKTIAAFSLFVIALAGIGYGIYRLTAKPESGAPSLQTAKLTRLTTTGKASAVAISPDGKYVVHVEDDGGQQSLWVRQVATQSNVQIVAPAAVRYSGLTFSPDGDYIYYAVTSQELPKTTLFQVPTLGGAPKKLISGVSTTRVSFSPDGKQFAFARIEPGAESALMIAGADGTAERTLVSSKNLSEVLNNPAWSPDGKRIAYVLTNIEEDYTLIFEAQMADGVTKPLTARKWLGVGSLVWLPDGSGLLMRSAPGHQSDSQIFYLSYSEGEARQITNDLNRYADMSLAANSSTLAVVQSETQASIWTMPAGDMSRARPVTSGSSRRWMLLSWTPDGGIAMTRTRAATWTSGLWARTAQIESS